jgi:hypothetical protein
MLRSISRHKTVLGPFLSKISSEFITGKLTTAIGMQAFDVHTMLSLCPGCKVLISFESLVLGVKYIEFHVTSAVIHEGNIVASATETVSQ